jgi:hypothetical protein
MGAKPIERIDDHKDGSIRAKGHTVTGSDRTARECGLDTLKIANRQVNGRLMMPGGKVVKVTKIETAD